MARLLTRRLWLATLASMCLAVVWIEAQAAIPSRIVSTSPSITETLFALGLGDRVVGVSTYCRYPAAVSALPKVGTFLKPNAEIIVRLRPDLVFVHEGPHDVARQLSALSVRTVSVDRGTLSSIFSTIRAVAAAAGAAGSGERLVADLERHLDRVRDAVAGRPRRKVLMIVGRRPGTLTNLMAVGKGSYLNDLVGIAGGVNVLGDGVPEYPTVSIETVNRLAPDVIVDAGDMGDTAASRRQREAATIGLWRAQTLVAAAKGSVHAVTSDAFVVPGPRVVEVAETLAAWIHGVTFK